MTPTVSDGLVYFGGPRQPDLRDAKSGKKKWSVHLVQELEEKFRLGLHRVSSCRSGPRHLHPGGKNSSCRSTQTGKVLWRSKGTVLSTHLPSLSSTKENGNAFSLS